MALFAKTLLMLCHLPIAATICNGQSASPPNTFEIRGKALPIIFLATGFNVSLGAEYGFGKMHAIGLDAGYTFFNTPRERYDSASGNYKSAPRVNTTIRGAMLSYRAYLPTKTRNGYSRRFYGSVFVRLGDQVAAPQKGYDGTLISFRQLEKSVGLLYGILLPYETNGLCLDLSIGPFWKWKDVHDEARSGRGVTVSDYRSDNFGVRIGFNVAYVGRR